MTTSHFQRNACIERMTPRVGPDSRQVPPDGKLIVSSVVHQLGNGWASPQHDAITKAEQNDLRRSIKNLLATPGAVELRLDDDDEVIAAEVPTDTPVLPGEFLAKLKEEKPATTIGPQLSQDDQLLKRAGEDIGACGIGSLASEEFTSGRALRGIDCPRQGRFAFFCRCAKNRAGDPRKLFASTETRTRGVKMTKTQPRIFRTDSAYRSTKETPHPPMPRIAKRKFSAKESRHDHADVHQTFDSCRPGLQPSGRDGGAADPRATVGMIRRAPRPLGGT